MYSHISTKSYFPLTFERFDHHHARVVLPVLVGSQSQSVLRLRDLLPGQEHAERKLRQFRLEAALHFVLYGEVSFPSDKDGALVAQAREVIDALLVVLDLRKYYEWINYGKKY